MAAVVFALVHGQFRGDFTAKTKLTMLASRAGLVFGGKYVSLTTPKNPMLQRITSSRVVDARGVTTEINTLFQTSTSIAQQRYVDGDLAGD